MERARAGVWFGGLVLAAIGGWVAWRIGSAAVELRRGEAPARSAGVAGTPVLETNLERGNFDAWARHILPDADELAFERIGWRPSFAEGVAAAAAEGRPLLVWGMNGHPLGCT